MSHGQCTDNAEVNRFFCEALFKIDYEKNVETLLPTVLKVGEINLKCMALLDKANTETYVTPEPTAVTLTVEKRTIFSHLKVNFQNLCKISKADAGFQKSRIGFIYGSEDSDQPTAILNMRNDILMELNDNVF